VTGVIVPPLDPQAIACAILRLLQDPELRICMAREGQRRAATRYDLDTCADTHVRAFARAAAHHKWRRP